MRRIGKAAREAKTCGGGGSVEGPSMINNTANLKEWADGEVEPRVH
jgi:hypothetical protein